MTDMPIEARRVNADAGQLPAAPATGTPHYFVLLLVLSLLSIGTALRCYQLDSKGLWSDELFSANVAVYRDAIGSDQIKRFRKAHWMQLEEADTFWTAKAAEHSPPLFDVLAKMSTTLLGPTEAAMRMPSLIASVLLLIFFGFLALSARHEREANAYLLLLMLFTFCAAAIEYAQEARAYSLGLLFSAVLCTLLFKRLNDGLEQSELPRWPEIVVFILACHTHYNLLAFCGVLLLVYLYLAFRRGDRRAALRLLVVPLACIPWVALSAHTVLLTARGGEGWAGKMDLGSAVVQSLKANQALLGRNFVLLALVLALAFLVTRLVRGERSSPLRRNLDLAVLLALGAAYLLIAAKVAASAGILHPRYLLFGLPVTMLLVAAITTRISTWRPAVLTVGVVLAATQLPLIHSYFASPKEGYREAAQWLLARLDPDAVIVTTWWPNRDYYRFYLERGGDKRLQLVSISLPEQAAQVCERISEAKSVGIFAHGTHGSLVEALVRQCGARFVRSEGSFHGILAQQWKPA